jgi:hypothetical protein
VAPVAIGTTEHNKAVLGHAKLTQVLGLAFGLRKLFERRPDQTTLKRKIQPKESYTYCVRGHAARFPGGLFYDPRV